MREKFRVLYSSALDSREPLDEVILLVYKAAEGEDNRCLLKLRTAPRRFDKYEICDTDFVRIYYWSNQLGVHLFKPFWAQKGEAFVIDLQELQQKAREQAVSEGKNYTNKETIEYLKIIKKLRADYAIYESGYFCNDDRFSSDWATSELSIHYGRGAFSIGDYNMLRLVVRSHWRIDEAWDMAEKSLSSKKWSINEFVEFLSLLDTYDTYVAIYYFEDNKVCSKSIYIDGSRIRGYEKHNWETEVVELIEKINKNRK